LWLPARLRATRGVAGEHDLPARPRGPEHRVGRDHLSVGSVMASPACSIPRSGPGAPRAHRLLRRRSAPAARARRVRTRMADNAVVERERLRVAVLRRARAPPRSELHRVSGYGSRPRNGFRRRRAPSIPVSIDRERHAVAPAQRERLQHSGEMKVLVRGSCVRKISSRSGSPTPVERAGCRSVPSARRREPLAAAPHEDGRVRARSRHRCRCARKTRSSSTRR